MVHVLGKKVAIFNWEWVEIWPLEKGSKSPGLQRPKSMVVVCLVQRLLEELRVVCLC